MCQSASFPPDTRVLRTFSTDGSAEFYVGWQCALGMVVVDAVQKLSNVSGGFSSKPCYETAAVRPERPGAVSPFTNGAYDASTNFVAYHEDLSITNAMFVRFGAAYKNSVGSAQGGAEVGLEFSVYTKGRILGTKNFMVNAGQTGSSDTNFEAVTDWDSIAGLNQLMAAFCVMENATDYLEYQLVIRTAVDRRQPNAWVNCEAAWANPSTPNSERNTGALSVPTAANAASNVWYQLGIAFRKKSGAVGNPRSNFAVIVAASRS